MLRLGIVVLGLLTYLDAHKLEVHGVPRSPSEPQSVVKAESFSCVNLPDDTYGVGCSSEFVACVRGHKMVYKCTMNVMKFDEPSHRCLPQRDVRACATPSIPPIKVTTCTTPEATKPEVEPTSSVAPSVPKSEGNNTEETVESGFLVEEESAREEESGVLVEGESGFLVEEESGVLVKEEESGIFVEEGSGAVVNEEGSGSGLLVEEESGLVVEEESGTLVKEEEPGTVKEEKSGALVELNESGIFVEKEGGLVVEKESGVVEKGSDALVEEKSGFAVEEELDAVVEASGNFVVLEGEEEPGSWSEYAESASGGACGTEVDEGSTHGALEVEGGFEVVEVLDIQADKPENVSVVEEGSTLTSFDNKESSAFESGMDSSDEDESFLCTGAADGTYSVGCSSSFVACVSGEVTRLSCPGSLLKFDESSHQCLPEANVSECRMDQPKPKAKESPVPEGLIAVFPSTFSCTTKPDGVYEQGCSGTFVVCFRESPVIMHCPTGLKFDSVSDRCLEPHLVKSCRQCEASSGAAEAEPGAKTTSRPTQASSSSEAAEFTCGDKHDGLYAQGTFDEFVKCFNGAAVLLLCPKGLDLDSVTAMCYLTTRHKRSVPSPKHSGHPMGLPLSSISGIGLCRGQSFGVVSKRCSSSYHVCLPQYAKEFRCPHDYVYDATRHHCQPASVVPFCKGTTKATKALPTSPAIPTPVKATTFSSPFSCADRADGFYPLGCSSRFIACSGGAAVVLRCPASMKFDSASSECLAKAYVSACGGSSTVMPKVSYISATSEVRTSEQESSTTYVPTIEAPTVSPLTTATTPCAGKSCPNFHPKMLNGRPHVVGDSYA